MIGLFPSDVFEKLEFDFILDKVRNGLLSPASKLVFAEETVSSDIAYIDQRLNETAEYKLAIENSHDLPLNAFESTQEDIVLLRKDGYVLSIAAIRRIYRIVTQSKDLMKYRSKPSHQKFYPLLTAICEAIQVNPAMLTEIDRVLDENGEVRDNASPELQRIQREIRNKEREIDTIFAKTLKKYSSEGWLTDSAESYRNGRRVLTAGAENKRRIEGVIHDESATGKTVYIEPAEVMVQNNAIFNLHTDRKKEIYKILQRLCDFLRPYCNVILIAEDVLIRLDIIRSKARLGIALDADRPTIIDKPNLGLKNARNPILYLKNKEVEKETVPFDLELHPPNKIIVISGPNAGGKSVTMKTVGVLQLMVQFGLLIPADANSKMGIFHSIYTDIGDMQSMEDDLSTYSGRLRNMKYFLDNADNRSLIIIDEFGSGTDPKIGGALAEAMLRDLNHKRCYGVITTHYSNLKYFAFKRKGLVNGSMEFDRAQLEPTYQLIIGKPGSSFAFEIASKTGLSDKLIKYAKAKAGKNEQAIEDLLTNLQSERQEIESKMEAIMSKEEKLDKMISSYSELHKELEFRRKKIKLEQKERKLTETARIQQKYDEAIKELQTEKNLEKVKKKAKAIQSKKSQISEEIVELNDAIYDQNLGNVRELKVGDDVKMRRGDARGSVMEIDGQNARVQMGILTLTVPLHELEAVDAPVQTYKKSVHIDTAHKGRAESKIDIRGYKITDADYALQEFLDKAIIQDLNQLTIIHGTGTGRLRKFVLSKLKEYKDVRSIRQPEDEHGGKGVTIVEL